MCEGCCHALTQKRALHMHFAYTEPVFFKNVENYVKVTGKAYYKILYMTQGETTLSVLEGKIPFEEMIYAENDGEETFFIRNERT